MKVIRLILAGALILGWGALAAQYAQNLFFSEYLEGSSNNKALEIFNGTGQTVDLSQYTVKLASNGGTWSTTNILNMTGSLAHGDVYVIANAQANAAIMAVADVSSTVTYFNGNDAVGLFQGNTMIDLIGIYQNDPGTAWPVAGVTGATLNHTLVRKPNVVSGTTNWAVSAGTNVDDSQWIVHPQDYVADLGSHTFTPSSADMTATPTFNPPGGVFTAPVSVSINCATPGASIYYTTNGSTPSTSSTLYTVPIAISSATTLKAIAVAPAMDPSYVATAQYLFPIPVANLSALASSPADGTTVYHVSGQVILTFKQTFRNQKYLQDSGAGILVDDQNGILATNYNVGDGITGITGTISEYGGMLQFVPTTAGPAPSSTNNPIVPVVVTFDNLFNNYNTYRSRVVQVMGVEFANPAGNFANGTVYACFDQDTDYNIRTTFYDVDYIGTPIPNTPKDIIGIPNSRVDGHYFTPRWLSDFHDPAGTVSAPVFNPAPGSYISPISVSMSSQTAGASIYYTTDGSVPSATSTLYTAPVPISQTTTLKAIAVLTGSAPSAVSTGQYFFPTAVNNLLALRNAPLGGPYMLLGEVVMTFAQDYRHQKFVQDNTGAMLIDDMNGVITQNYQVGDGITGLVGTTMSFGGMFEFVPLANPGAPSSTGNPLYPEPITVDQLNNQFGLWQSRLVSLQGVRFVSPDGSFANGSTYQLIDPSTGITGNFRSTFFDVDYIGVPLQIWKLNIVGIPNSRTDGIYFTARKLADFQINAIITPIVFDVEVLSNTSLRLSAGFATANNVNPPVGLSGYKLWRDDAVLYSAAAGMSFSYQDNDIPQGTHTYYVTATYGAIDSPPSQIYTHSTSDGNDPSSPAVSTQLKGNFPNPFNPSTNIGFSLKDSGKVCIEIFNTRGQKVRTLVDAHKNAGEHQIVWDGKDDRGHTMSSGLYYYRMKNGTYSNTKKMLMLK